MDLINYTVRRALDADTQSVADVWLRSFAKALPTVAVVHSDDQVRAWFREVVRPDRETWVAVVDDAVVGMLVLHEGDVDQLYVDPLAQGRGVGTGLLDVAKRRCPDGLGLWTFQVNVAAQRFYERRGFVATQWTDGAGNDEHEPDVRFEWKPPAAGSET